MEKKDSMHATINYYINMYIQTAYTVLNSPWKHFVFWKTEHNYNKYAQYIEICTFNTVLTFDILIEAQ